MIYLWISLVAQTVKHLLTMQETQIRPLGQEDVLEKEMTAHSSILAPQPYKHSTCLAEVTHKGKP